MKATFGRLERDFQEQKRTADAAKEQLARIRRKIKKKQERERNASANGANTLVNGLATPPPPLTGGANGTPVGNSTVESRDGKVVCFALEGDDAVLLQKAEKRCRAELKTLLGLQKDIEIVKDAIMHDVERDLVSDLQRIYH